MNKSLVTSPDSPFYTIHGENDLYFFARFKTRITALLSHLILKLLKIIQPSVVKPRLFHAEITEAKKSCSPQNRDHENNLETNSRLRLYSAAVGKHSFTHSPLHTRF